MGRPTANIYSGMGTFAVSNIGANFTPLTQAGPSEGNMDPCSGLQYPISHDVTVNPSWYVPNASASQAHCKERQGRARFLLRVFSEFSGLCAIHKLVKKRRPQTKADLPLLHCQTFQHLQAMQQLNRSFRKAGMDVKSNDDKHF